MNQEPRPEVMSGAVDEPTLRDYLGIFRRRRGIIAAAVLVTLGAALGSSFGQSPEYEATTTIVADRPGGVVVLFPEVAASGQSYVDTLVEILKSRTVAERAAELLGYAGPEVQEQADAIEASVSVQRVRFTDMIRIDARGSTPREAAARTDAVAQGFINLTLEGRRAQASAARQFIGDQLQAVSRDLRVAEEALVGFKARADSVSLSEETTLKISKLSDFEAQLAITRTERQSVEAQLNRARTELQRLNRITPITWTPSPLIAPLRQQLATLEVELAGLREQFTDRHPAVVATRAKIEEVKTKLGEQLLRTLDTQTYAVNPVYQQLSQQIVQGQVARYALLAKEQALGSTISGWSDVIKGLPPKELSLARLTRDQKVAEELYLLLSGKHQEARITEASVVPDIRVIDHAALPQVPVVPDIPKNIVLAGVLGALLGIVGAFGADALDRTFRNADDAERSLGLPLLAVVPRTNPAGRRNGFGRMPLFPRLSPQDPFAEAHRTLRTTLLYSAPEGAMRTVLVTSPGRAEGKTTTAVNLAASLAQLTGARVGLLEGNLRHPRLSALFGVERETGLSDYLVGGRSVAGEVGEADVVYRTPISDLMLVPAGRSTPNPSELLASARLGRFLEYLRGRLDIIVIDSPAVRLVSDAAILSRHVDGVVLVIRAGATQRDAALRARRQLEAVGAKIVGFVYNHAPQAAPVYTQMERPPARVGEAGATGRT